MPPADGDHVSVSVVGPLIQKSDAGTGRMNIIAHGGWYVMPEERDLSSAYYRALEAGMGVVVPIRDHNGRLVISHGPASDESQLFDDFLTQRPIWPGTPPILAIQVCADGLSRLLHSSLLKFDGVVPYVFGVSVTDMPAFMDGTIPLFVRQSEHEPQPAFYEFAEGVWLDSFERDWFDQRLIIQHLRAGKLVSIVSPELRERPVEPMWEMLNKLQAKLGELAMSLQLCTQQPQAAREFFGR